MAGWRDLGNIWTTFRQIDIGPIRQEAERPVVIAVVGEEGVGKSSLVSAFRHGARTHEGVAGTAIEAGLEASDQLDSADLAILTLDSSRSDFSAETLFYREWASAGRACLVFFNKMDLVGDESFQFGQASWNGARTAFGSAIDPDSLQTSLVPRVLEILSDRTLSLARHFPLFRIAVARSLVYDTSFANATYALGTGLAEVIPALDIPFNVADIVVLTKNQGILAYKLGLALGLSPRWQDHVSELGGVIGAGFLWRQVARQLVGLVPVWGILPKVAVAYAGTFAVGEAIIYWYQTGQKLSGQGMRELYMTALDRGRQIAQNLITRNRHSADLLPAPLPDRRFCASCGRENPSDAQFCAYCATPLSRAS